MSVKQKVYLKEVYEESYFCDLCNRPTTEYFVCTMCGCNMCREHTVFDPNDHGDYPGKYCTKCWEIGEPYRIEYDKIEEEADRKCDQQMNAWQQEVDKRG